MRKIDSTRPSMDGPRVSRKMIVCCLVKVNLQARGFVHRLADYRGGQLKVLTFFVDLFDEVIEIIVNENVWGNFHISPVLDVYGKSLRISLRLSIRYGAIAPHASLTKYFGALA
ncbi:MAG: hypothetical protein LBK60_06900 [Verrucomicrobiales bacterium]|nr:hypothetical protein [Verrucomicrobiales bacterium]